MADRWAAVGVSFALALSGCGGKSVREMGASNQAGSGGAGGEVSGASGQSGGGSAGSGARLHSGAWDVALVTAPSNPTVDTADCENIWLTLDLVGQGDSLHAFLGADGTMAEADFVRSPDNNSLWLAAPFAIVPPSRKCHASSYEFKTFNLYATHGLLDSANEFGLIAADGTASASFTVGDVVHDVDMGFIVQGTPDQTRPTVGADSVHNPLDRIWLDVSEPLQNVQLSLVANDSDPALPSLDFAAPPAGGALIRLDGDRILPFSHTWHLAGSAGDFAGNQLVTGNILSTVKDPGVFAQDGFRVPRFASLTGNAQFIDQSYGVTIPNSDNALLVVPDSSATFHLTRSTPGPGAVSLEFSELFTDPVYLSYGGDVTMDAAVIGGSKMARGAFVAAGPTTSVNVDQWKVMSTASRLVVPLPETGSDVVVRFRSSSCQQLPCPPIALLIDDLILQ